MDFTVSAIATIKSDFEGKFGVPRQSGLAEELGSEIVFVPKYRNPDAVRGLEGFSHIWLIWQFSGIKREGWSPTVRPPRLGGNERLGVFATRSPNRPNPIGLSAVRLEGIEYTKDRGPVLHVLGADLMDGTPILDIKPYLPYADCRVDAVGGFAHEADRKLEVDFPKQLLERIPPQSRRGLISALAQDPRPAYQKDPQRVYGFGFAGCEVRFTVSDGVVHVVDIFSH